MREQRLREVSNVSEVTQRVAGLGSRPNFVRLKAGVIFIVTMFLCLALHNFWISSIPRYIIFHTMSISEKGIHSVLQLLLARRIVTLCHGLCANNLGCFLGGMI